jgi:peptidoglycan-associated lipoprotein
MTRRIAIVLVLAACLACRSRVKNTPAPAVVPPAPSVAEAAPQPVTPPSHDFVQEARTADDLPVEVTDLNRIAHERGWIADAFFDFDRSTLRADAQQALTNSAQWLRAHPDVAVVLEGHCDERGTEQYNLALGDRRAHIAREYLVSLGIAGDRIRSVSYGEERPFATGSDEESLQQNRRAHVVLTRK